MPRIGESNINRRMRFMPHSREGESPAAEFRSDAFYQKIDLFVGIISKPAAAAFMFKNISRVMKSELRNLFCLNSRIDYYVRKALYEKWESSDMILMSVAYQNEIDGQIVQEFETGKRVGALFTGVDAAVEQYAGAGNIQVETAGADIIGASQR
jgi:hypothetical protein